jgi:hypothetical protein
MTQALNMTDKLLYDTTLNMTDKLLYDTNTKFDGQPMHRNDT